jgi:N-acetylglutamate synthase-like GNAT family acetyltransferase
MAIVGPAMSVSATIRVAQASDLNRIITAYETWGYKRGVAPVDTVWIAEAAGDLIGVVRIAPENGTLVLRGMRIGGIWQRQGIGSALLRVLAEWLGDRECFCVPYTHLIEFYGQIGFVELESGAAPAFLSDRLAEYKNSGLDVTIMRRFPPQ